jgi:Rrf2 family iron-sulfur cluster assembly transcriptional regulator
MLSNTSEYALRAVIYLGEREGSGTIRVDQVAAALDVPKNYLSKILHALAKQEVLRSLRGPKGGFELARPATEITLFEVVSAFDDIEARRTCLLGRRECSDTNPCAIHGHWREVATQVATFFRETTLAEVVKSAGELGGVLGRE